jgi:glutamate/tyrosine decarboxylase-like PLP-dependent enzyme
LAAAERMRDNYPYHHPLYVGQMLKPPHAVARLAYALATWINPNNHALDGGRASSAMEKEAVTQIAKMFGWNQHLGHLCGGGTIANFEALWVGRELRPGKAVAASSQAHYTHSRLSAVLGVPFQKISVDAFGRMNVADLESALASGSIGTVVATLGTTAAGTVDPLPEILKLRERFDFRLHVDTAYGGYFTLVDNLDASARQAFDCIGEADSIVIDPHKHGLQPYGCGCALFRDPSVGRFYKHNSPYTYFSSDDLHLGEISLECSRPGASAVALWTTMRLLPLQRGGEFAKGLAAGREAAIALHNRLAVDSRFAPLFAPELDIVVWAMRAQTATESSARARQVFATAAALDHYQMRKRRARHHHIAARFLGLHLKFSLNVREEAEEAGALLELAFQLGNGGERLRVGVVQIENDERRFLFAVLLNAVQEFFVGLDEFHLHAQLARGFLNLGHKEQVFHKSKNSCIRVFSCGRNSFRNQHRIGSWHRGASVSVAQRGAVAVIHGRAVNPARIVLPLVASLPLLVLAALALTASLLRLPLILSWLLTSGMATTTAPALAGRPGRVVTWIHRFLGLLNCVHGEPFCGFAGFVAVPCHTVARYKAFLQFDHAGSKPC